MMSGSGKRKIIKFARPLFPKDLATEIVGARTLALGKAGLP
jgi:hypothetical protein